MNKILYLLVKFNLTIENWTGYWYSTIELDTDTFQYHVEEEVDKKRAKAFKDAHNLKKVYSDDNGTVYDTESQDFKKFYEKIQTYPKKTPQYTLYKELQNLLK